MEGADSEIQQLCAQWEAIQLHDGILYINFLGTNSQMRWKQLLVPRSLRAPLLLHFHAGPTAGHMGIKKTQDRKMKIAYWRGGGPTWYCSVDGAFSATVIDGFQTHFKANSNKPPPDDRSSRSTWT